MSTTDWFSPDYATARRRFLEGAERRGFTLSAEPVRARGPNDGELAVDVAYLGPESPRRVVALSSGVHGVEGFAGSAVQLRLLGEQLDGLSVPADTGLLLVHAINPFGFAWQRRVNEHNVDLNRNFVTHPEGHVANPDYDALFDAINPERLDPESDDAARARLLGFASEHGMPRLQSVLTSGQYVHPQGVQFGGQAAEDSNRALRAVAARETRGAVELAWLDVHTGLGPYGVAELITECPPDHPAYARGRDWYGESVQSTADGGSVSAALNGVMEIGLEESLPAGTELTAFAAEFGTFDPVRVFWAMRADNWLWSRGDADSDQGRSIRAELLEVFRPDDPAWQRDVLDRAATLVEQTLRGGRG